MHLTILEVIILALFIGGLISKIWRLETQLQKQYDQNESLLERVDELIEQTHNTNVISSNTCIELRKLTGKSL